MNWLDYPLVEGLCVTFIKRDTAFSWTSLIRDDYSKAPSRSIEARAQSQIRHWSAVPSPCHVVFWQEPIWRFLGWLCNRASSNNIMWITTASTLSYSQQAAAYWINCSASGLWSAASVSVRFLLKGEENRKKQKNKNISRLFSFAVRNALEPRVLLCILSRRFGA